MLMLLDIAITGGVNLRPNFSPGVIEFERLLTNSQKAVLHDGGSQSTPKTYFVARSFTTEDPKEAWNITSYLSNYGLVGMESILLKE